MDGILESNALWLSDPANMNDRKELHWVEELCRRGGFEAIIELADLYRRYEGRTAIFLGCFSRDADVTNQWMQYAKDGSGVALGFSRAELENMVAHKMQRVHRMKEDGWAGIIDVSYGGLKDHSKSSIRFAFSKLALRMRWSS